MRKRRFSSSLLMAVFLLSSTLGLFLVLLGLILVSAAQDCCPPPVLNPAAARFPQGALVTVYVDGTSGFTFAEFLQIKQGLEEWNDQANRSGVKYDVRWTDSPPPVGGHNTIIARFVDQHVTSGGAQLNMHQSGSNIYGELKFFNNIREGSETTQSIQLRNSARHEGGHGIGLENAQDCPFGSTIMNPSWTSETFITNCDNEQIDSQSTFYPPTPTPTPPPSPTPTPCAEQGQLCHWNSDCCASLICGEVTGTCYPCEPDANHPQFGPCMSEACSYCYNVMEGTYCDPWTNNCWTPILIDVDGDGFGMTSLEEGVIFDGFGSGTRMLTAWTETGADDAWLVLDRNGNGLIDDGTELFSSAAPQPLLPPPAIRHGFNALVQYDEPENGGNKDGVLDPHDSIFEVLRLWQDINHNGISDPSELHPLLGLGVHSIAMDYKLSKRKDRHGNVFTYRAKVEDGFGVHVGRWAYDVYPLARSLSTYR